MLPVLFNMPGLTLFTFGAFLVLSLLWSSFWFWKNIKLTSYKEEDFFDGLFLSIFGGIILGRIIFVALNFSEFGFDILKFVLINGFPGLSLYGLLIGAGLTFFIYTKAKKRPYLEMIDYAISPLFLGLAIASVGAFLSGTVPGTKTKLFLSVRYLGLDGTRHLPALYEALFYVLGFYIAHRIILLVRRQRISIGTNFFFFIFYFSLINLLLDFIKANHLYFLSFSFNLVLSALFSTISGLYFIFVYRDRIKKILLSFKFKKKNEINKPLKKTTT